MLQFFKMNNFSLHEVQRGIKKRGIYDTSEENCRFFSHLKWTKKLCVHFIVSQAFSLIYFMIIF